MKIKVSLFACLILIISANAFSAINFIPRLTLREEYSDNIDLTPDHQRSDWITSIAPGAFLEFLGKKYSFYIDYEPSLVMYNRYTEYDTWRHRGIVGAWADLSRYTRFELENISMYTEEPVSEYDTTLRRNRNQYFLNRTSTDLYHQFGPENYLDVGYSYEFINNEDEELDDTKRHEPYILLTYWPVANEWGTETELRYRKGLYEVEDDFDFWTAGIRIMKRFFRNIDGSFRYYYSKMEYEGAAEGYQLHEFGPGFLYAIDENTNISVDLVYLYRDRDISEDQSEIHFISEILKRWIFHRNYIEVVGSSGYQPDTFGAENNGFDLFAEITGRYTYNFSRQTHWDIFGGARYDKYLDVEPEDQRIENTFRAGTAISYRALSWLTFRLEYGYRRLLSEIYENEYEENRVMLTLTMMPSRGEDALRNRSDERRGRMSQRERNAESTGEGDSRENLY